MTNQRKATVLLKLAKDVLAGESKEQLLKRIKDLVAKGLLTKDEALMLLSRGQKQQAQPAQVAASTKQAAWTAKAKRLFPRELLQADDLLREAEKKFLDATTELYEQRNKSGYGKLASFVAKLADRLDIERSKLADAMGKMVLGGSEKICNNCYDCLNKSELGLMNPVNSQMILCEICGNKRCPHATNHNNNCTNSNAVGQEDSIYGGRK